MDGERGDCAFGSTCVTFDGLGLAGIMAVGRKLHVEAGKVGAWACLRSSGSSVLIDKQHPVVRRAHTRRTRDNKAIKFWDMQ